VMDSVLKPVEHEEGGFWHVQDDFGSGFAEQFESEREAQIWISGFNKGKREQQLVVAHLQRRLQEEITKGKT
jgi:hypothetical protein